MQTKRIIFKWKGGDVRIKDISKEISEVAKSKGWSEKKRSIPELLCLIHSEVSEALEGYRNRDTENFNEELADIAIRLFHMCEYLNVDLEAEIRKKVEFNKTREYKHGGKVC